MEMSNDEVGKQPNKTDTSTPTRPQTAGLVRYED